MNPYSVDKAKRKRKFNKSNLKGAKNDEFIIFEVEDFGDEDFGVKKLNITEEQFRENNAKDILDYRRVFVIFKKELGKIYIWNGVRSTSRQQELASIMAKNLRYDLIIDERAHRPKIVYVDAEPLEFLKNFGIESTEILIRLAPKAKTHRVLKAKTIKERKINKHKYTYESVIKFLNGLRWFDVRRVRTEHLPVSNNGRKKGEKKEYDYTFKIIVLGTPRKTALIHRILTGVYAPDIKMTIGVDFNVKSMEINGKKIKLQIWDFGGEIRDKFLLPQYVRETNGVIIIYDDIESKTFKNISEIIEIVNEIVGEIPIILAIPELPSNAKEFVNFTEKYTLTEITSEIGPKGKQVFELLTEKMLEHEQ